MGWKRLTDLPGNNPVIALESESWIEAGAEPFSNMRVGRKRFRQSVDRPVLEMDSALGEKFKSRPLG
jgi:hypothetical protein